MIIEEYKKKLENWKEEHTNFYNECLHAMKNEGLWIVNSAKEWVQALYKV